MIPLLFSLTVDVTSTPFARSGSRCCCLASCQIGVTGFRQENLDGDLRYVQARFS